MAKWNRRSMLRLGVQAAVIGTAGATMLTRTAKGSSVNRAVVCIYLFGGNDSNNVLVPLSRYDEYARARGPLALPQEVLLQAESVSGEQYGFHPAMPEIADLFLTGSVAVVANVGRVSGPLNGALSNNSAGKAEFNALQYEDESLQFLPGGYVAPGWARELTPPEEAVTGFPGIRGASGVSLLSNETPASRAGISAMIERGANAMRGLGSAFPATGIGQQLRSIAGAIAAGGGTQVFLAQMGGFDTRSNQLETQGALLRDLSAAMGAFYRATRELGIANRVVTYTDTEFSRTLSPNLRGGSERGWGGHQIVMGSPVVGGKVYGEFPELALGGPRDVTGSGVWLPAISADRYSAAFANWMGMPSAGVAGPELNFLA
jgi:uncharacterized protein (DUF1501 family)